MPLSTNNTWYFDKKELKSTPSIQDGLDYNTELRYRREGARLILDIGNKMGLRFDTIWTGVLYFHRFYMFRSFKDFPRYVTATCCLFLAGKVEETPKKCKDLIKFARMLLDDIKFAQFGEDPREEVMILERILLQTMNFDLQVDHSYSYLLRYAKNIKNVDDAKKQKMVQMAWTFINDSLQTTLHLQWEPDVIAVALMFLASRLTKLEIKDWVGRDPSVKVKWFEAFVEGVTQPLLEDVCHQVLDLYSSVPQKTTTETRSPNQPAGGTPSSAGHTPSSAGHTPTQQSNRGLTTHAPSHGNTLNPPPSGGQHSSSSTVSTGHSHAATGVVHPKVPTSSEPPSGSASAANTPQGSITSNSHPREDQHQGPTSSSSSAVTDFSSFNPYVSQFSGSFLNTEGQKTIQHLLSGGGSHHQAARTHHHPSQPPQAPPPPPPSAAPVLSAVAAVATGPPGYQLSTTYHPSSATVSHPPTVPPPSGVAGTSAPPPPSADYHHSHQYLYQHQPPPHPYSLPPPGYAAAAGAPAPTATGVYFAPAQPPSHHYAVAPPPQPLPYAAALPGLPPGQHHPGAYAYHPSSHGPYAPPPTNHM